MKTMSDDFEKDGFNPKSRDFKDFSKELVDKVAAMTREERKSYYTVSIGAMGGNERAYDLMNEKFGTVNLKVCWQVMYMCAESLTPSERREDEILLEQRLKYLSSFPTLPEDVKKIEREDSVPKLLTYRMKAGLTQKQLAEKAGVHVTLISKIERGVAKLRNLTLANAVALADALGVKAEDLL
jgi:DNA-binding XRE family transcriptional regulator